jgi:type IV secretion system protein TrbL
VFAWALILLAFFILAIQLFITLIEFKLTTLAGFVLIPFGLFGKSAFMAERVLGNVISSGIKVLVLAVIIGIGSTLFSEFTQGSTARRPRSTTPWRSCWPRCRCWAWASSALASPTASSPAARSSAPARRSAPVCRRRHGRSGCRRWRGRVRRRCPCRRGAAAARGGRARGGASTAYSLGAAGQSGASGVASGLGNVASAHRKPARPPPARSVAQPLP